MTKYGQSLDLQQEQALRGADAPCPLIRFFQMIAGMRPPEPADDEAAGTMPARAHRLCEAMRSASAFGWYLYPPIGFTVMWDGGSEIVWTYPGADAWYSINTVHFPGFPAEFSRAAPADLRPFVPPFLTALREPGILQVWTGALARTAPGWSALVRSPANLPHSKAYDFLEGMIKTDSWFGPLFTTIRLTRTHAPIEFKAEHPLLQVQPVHRASCCERLDRYQVIPDMGGMTADDWAAFRQTVVQPAKGSRSTTARSRFVQKPAGASTSVSAYSNAARGDGGWTPGTAKKRVNAQTAAKRGSTAPGP